MLAGMMHLAQYLSENGITQDAFAKKLGVQQSTVSRLVKRKFTPRLDLALAVERETGGAVPVTTWAGTAE